MTALFLVNGYRRRKALNGIAICFFHLADELTCIRRQALNVPPLTLGVQGVKSEAGFPRARNTRNHDEFALWKVDGDVLEVVGSSPLDLNPTFLACCHLKRSDSNDRSTVLQVVLLLASDGSEVWDESNAGLNVSKTRHCETVRKNKPS